MFPSNSLSFVVLLIASIIFFLLISFSFLSSFIFFLFYFLIINKYFSMKSFWFRWCGKLNLFVSSYIVRTAEPRLGQALDSGLGWNFWNSTNFQNFLFLLILNVWKLKSLPNAERPGTNSSINGNLDMRRPVDLL